MVIFPVGSDLMTDEEMDRIDARVLELVRPEMESLRHEMELRKVRFDVDPKKHHEDHDWLRIERTHKIVRIARNRKIIDLIVGTIAVGFVTGIGTVIVQWFMGVSFTPGENGS